MVHDLIVIGGGPAGLTAGVYGRTRNLSTLVLEAEEVGGQLSWLYPTKSVYDYPSYIAIEGHELGLLLVEHARVSGVEIREGETVEEVRRNHRGSEVRTNKSTHEGRAVIVAIGNGPFNPRVLEIALELVAPAKEVTLVHRRGEFRAMEKNVEAVQKSPVKVLYNSELVSIEDASGGLDAV